MIIFKFFMIFIKNNQYNKTYTIIIISDQKYLKIKNNHIL